MKTIKTLMAMVVTTTAMGGVANAIEFRNFDSQNHTVRITSPSLDKEYEFRAMTTSLVICVDKCKFVVPGLGTVTATRNDIVTIVDGKMTALKVPVAPPPKQTRRKGSR